MAKPKSSRRHKPRAPVFHPPSKQSSRSRAKLVFLGIALFCIAATLVFLIARRQPNASRHSAPAPAPASQPIEPLIRTALTTEQQVTALREATTKLAEDLVARFPQEVEAHVLRGDVHRRFGRSADAVACWRDALEIDPRQISAYDRIAIVDMEKGQFEEAISLWRQVLALDPATPGVHDKLGRVLMALGQQDEAIGALTEEIRISPTSARTYCLLGQAHLQKNRYEQAIGPYEKALALDPNLSDACYGLATAHARLRHPEKARQYRERFRVLSSQEPEERPYGFSPPDDLIKARADFVNHAMRGATLLQSKGSMPAAAVLLQQAVAVDPNHVDCRKRLAALYRRAARLPEALRQCELIARLEPADPMCQLLIGSLALQLKQPRKAEAAFKKLVALAPGAAVGHQELAKLYLGSGKRSTEARRHAERAVELEPSAENYFVLAQACYQAGDAEAALTAGRKAIQLDPRNMAYQRTYNTMKVRH